ncbi:AAA family ATPase [Bacillus thuringiensis]|uniref:AAA family ATPase n=1 Tax=Bacillus thuringiensis TaxID=1428 RepID=UPI000BFD1B18|nr:AAA family ATPase [Bacillus thuringiensis]PGW44455.1 hypothetical protein COE03_19715 [Bacillus thuringiensis]
MKKKDSKIFLLIVISIFSVLSSVWCVSPIHSYADSHNGDGKEAIFMIESPAAGKSHMHKQLYPHYSVINPEELRKDAWMLLQKWNEENPDTLILVNGEEHAVSEYSNILMNNYEEANILMVELTYLLSRLLAEEAYESTINKKDSFVYQYDTDIIYTERIKREMVKAKEQGFNIVLLYVFAPLEVCFERNREQDKPASEDVVRGKWNEVQESWNELKELSIIDEIKEIK